MDVSIRKATDLDFTYDRVSMARSIDIWSCFVYFRVDGERSSVDRLIAYNYLAFLVDQDEVRDAYLREMLGQRVEPLEWISHSNKVFMIYDSQK